MPGDSLTNDFDKIVADCKRLACQIVRMGMMPFSAMASQQALLDFCSRSNELAARLAEQGIACTTTTTTSSSPSTRASTSWTSSGRVLHS